MKFFKISVVLQLALFPDFVLADPLSVFVALQSFIGTTAALFVANNLTAIGISIATSIYGSSAAKRKARKARARARNAFNASLEDRSITLLQALPPWRVIYGRCVVGGDVIAIFTSDKTKYRRDGSTYLKPDALKHLVIHLATTECENVHEVYVSGKPIGMPPGGGWATDSEFLTGRTEQRTVTFTNSTTVALPVVKILSARNTAFFSEDTQEQTITLSNGNLTLTGPPGVQVTVVYTTEIQDAAIRVGFHLGADNQTVDTYLNAVKPSEWTSDHRLRGLTYAVVTLDLEDQRFQGGIPDLTFDVSGKKIYDPGTGLNTWSDNPARCAYDFLVSEYGYGVDADEIDLVDFGTAVTACDEIIGLSTVSGFDTILTVPGKRYTCNGAFDTSSSTKEEVLESICESMCGYVVDGAAKSIIAGVWTAPLPVGLTDNDLAGQIETLQTGSSSREVFNGVRGTYIASGKSVPEDYDEYKNAAFVNADGEPLWSNVDLPFVNNKSRARNIARIITERARAGLVIQYPAKMLAAMDLRVGQRIPVTSAEYGFVNKIFRVTDNQLDARAPVMLTLQEDAAEIYDQADAATADPTPNTGLKSPWHVPSITILQLESGSEHLLLSPNGVIAARVFLEWQLSDDGAYVVDGTGRIELAWAYDTNLDAWETMTLPGDQTQVYIVGVQEKRRIHVRLYAINGFGLNGPITFDAHTVVGKTAAPTPVANLSSVLQSEGVYLTWSPCLDLDYEATELRYGASWSTGAYIWSGRASGFVWKRPANAAYRVWASHSDTSGNYSVPVYIDVNVDGSTAQGEYYRVVARGYSSVTHPAEGGLYSASDNSLIFYGGYRGFNVYTYDRVSGQFISAAVFDVFSNAANATAMAAYLNTQASNGNRIVVVQSADEPSINRLTNGLAEAMYRCGASPAVYGSPNFKFRSAYVLIGIAGCGVGNGFEAYQGVVDADPGAWVDVTFQIQNGNLIVSGTATTPKTLSDYGYLGSLTATSDIQLFGSGVSITGNSVTKTTLVHAWDAGVQSKERYANGCVATFAFANTGMWSMAGLSTSVAGSYSYELINYALYLQGGVLSIRVNGSSISSLTYPYVAGDICSIEYDGSVVRFFSAGTLLTTIEAASKGMTFGFRTSQHTPGSTISNIRFESLSTSGSGPGATDNLILNPNGEIGPHGITPAWGWVGEIYSNRNLNVFPYWDGYFLGVLNRDVFVSEAIAVQPNEQFYFEMECIPEGGTTGTYDFGIGMRVSTDYAGLQNISFILAAVREASASGKVFRSGTLTIPQGVKFARIWLQVAGPWDTTGTYYASRLKCIRVVNTDQITTGAATDVVSIYQGSGASGWTPQSDEGGISVYSTLVSASVINTTKETANVEASAAIEHWKTTTGGSSGNCGIIIRSYINSVQQDEYETAVETTKKTTAVERVLSVPAGQSGGLAIIARKSTSYGSSVTVNHAGSGIRCTLIKR